MSAMATLGPAERLQRARRIGTTFGRIYLGIKANQFVAQRIRPSDMPERWSRFNRDSARSIYEAAVDLRGLILKGCQFLGSRADVLPPEYVQILSQLQDRVPAKPFRVVRRTVERELGRDLDSVFRSFSTRPVASASLAQVHEATLHDGRRVAVKVQYPEIEALVRSDLANLRLLFRAVGILERDLDLMPLVDELGTQVPMELDFVNEGRNAEATARIFQERGDIVIPTIHWAWTRRRVLVMDYLEGIKITDAAGLRRAGVEATKVVQLLAEAYCEQILGHGFFHADPHPGNLFVDPDGPKLILLDFGLTKTLPPRFRESVIELVLAMLAEDAGRMGEILVHLGFETRNGSSQALSTIASVLIEAAQELRAHPLDHDKTVRRLRVRLPVLIRENPIVRVPTHVVLLARVFALLSGVARSLGTRFDLAGTLVPYAFRVRDRGR